MKELSKELQLYYSKVSVETISYELKERLHEVADKLVDEYMKKTDIEIIFTSKVGAEMKDDVLVIQLKAKVNE